MGRWQRKETLIYISDLVDFVKIVIKKQKTKFGLYNVGSEKLISINELTDKIIKISNKNIKKINDISKKLKNLHMFKLLQSKERFWMEAKNRFRYWYKKNY